MKTARYLFLAFVLAISTLMAHADETITVSSTGSDISENLDLRAVATLFGEVSNLEEFEQQLNSEERHISNLDLNGDGVVDYLRVVEMESNGSHLIIIQAVLAKDIYQDVASIYVEKDEANQISVQVVGDVWLYGENYIIEPVYIYRPVIYDWFWATTWVCWHSPWYWGYWPVYWGHGWAPWTYTHYCHHVYDYHHAHTRCTYRYPRTASARGASMRSTASSRGVSRRDVAAGSPERGFSARNTGMTNARQIDARRAETARSARSAAVEQNRAAATRKVSTSATFDSSFQRRSVTATSRSASTLSSRSTATSTTRSTTATTSTPARTSSSTTTMRSTTSTYTPPRTSTSTSTSRSTGTYSGSTTRSTGSYGGGVRSGGGGSVSRGGGGGSSRGGGGSVRR